MALQDAREFSLQIVESTGPNGETLGSLILSNNSNEVLSADWRLYFSLGLKPSANEDRIQQTLIDGRYGYLSPGEAWEDLAPGDQIAIPIESWLFDRMPLRARQGFDLSICLPGSNREERLGEPLLLEPLLLPLTTPPAPWLKDISPSADLIPMTPEHVFEKNEASQHPADHLTIVPFPKSFKTRGELVSFPSLAPNHAALASVLSMHVSEKGLPVNASIDESLGRAAYMIVVSSESVSISAGSDRAVYYAGTTLLQLISGGEEHYQLPACTINDEPDFTHRCLFIDIARHYQAPAELKKVIHAMSLYKMNRLQLGIANDEGWRLEISSIPELTEVGARRSADATDSTGKPRGLYPAWGDGSEADHHYLSRTEFIDLLRFAAEHQVDIIPEINLPAHANALIRAMSASGRYQIVDPDDPSVHQSAQGYQHNVANVCSEDLYRLTEKILEAVLFCYQQAGVALTHLHLGGDEVPAGAWLQSPLCRSSEHWQENWDVDTDAEQITEALLKAYAERIQQLVARVAPNTTLGFWHEMSPHLGRFFSGYVNGWTTEAGDRQLIQALLAREQQLVISNASYLYLDMPYGLHTDEPGLPWAAYIDEQHIYEFDPLGCWQIPEEQQTQVMGIQAQLWTETIYSPELMHYHLFPRLLAVAERAWNAVPDKKRWPAFAQALGQRELARLDELGITYRVPPPGARVFEGSLHASVAFPGLRIHYTTDGSDPDESSTPYTGPLPCNLFPQFKLVTVTGSGRRSRVITIDIQETD
jgi:hexosaminidase